MKRYGNLFDKVCDLDNIKLAHTKASKDKSFYKEVQMVNKDVDYYAKQIQDMLINKTYTIKPSDYNMFKKIDKGKEREIFKLDYFPHRIIQHALMNIIKPLLLNTFIDNTFASIPKRGVHLALKRLTKDLSMNKEDTKYCLKLDVQKFYPSINQAICKQLFRKKFKDDDLLWLIDTIINSMGGNKGIAIGSLFSQWAGNYYLTYFDHWIKEEKKMKFYYRYCDDIVILHKDKNFVHNVKLEIEDYFTNKLDIEIKNNWQVFPTRKRGIDFLGFRHFDNFILLRKSTSKTLIKKMRRILKKCRNGKEMSYSEWCSINSYKGWLKWCNGHNLYKKYVEPLEMYAEKYYKKNIKTGKRNEPKIDATNLFEEMQNIHNPNGTDYSWLFDDIFGDKNKKNESTIDLNDIFGDGVQLTNC